MDRREELDVELTPELPQFVHARVGGGDGVHGEASMAALDAELAELERQGR